MSLTTIPASQEIQITSGEENHILTNINCWSADGRFILFDTRSDLSGSIFDCTKIHRVEVSTGKIELLYESKNGAYCGVVTAHPTLDACVFIHGPEYPDKDGFVYGPARRHGLIVGPGTSVETMDARDLVPPFTPGALRGGSHVHVWHPKGDWISFTYEDHFLEENYRANGKPNPRVVGVSVPGPIIPQHFHARNQSGTHFSVIVTPIASMPLPGSDDLLRACEEGWIGIDGYVRSDGFKQKKALAFQGTVLGKMGEPLVEVFVCDLPEDLKRIGLGPLSGTKTELPFPPDGVAVRRLTYSENRRFPGIQGARHWLRSSPDGSNIAYLARDDSGVVQLWLVETATGKANQLTRNQQDISSAFTWTPDGTHIAHGMDGSLCLTSVFDGTTKRLTIPDPNRPIRPEACVVSPDGAWIAYSRTIQGKNQIVIHPRAFS